jgi:hypothetical protein
VNGIRPVTDPPDPTKPRKAPAGAFFVAPPAAQTREKVIKGQNLPALLPLLTQLLLRSFIYFTYIFPDK